MIRMTRPGAYRTWVWGGFAMYVLLGAGCSHTEQGITGGGVLGAVAGTAVGAATGRPLTGAAVGAGLGAAVGGAAGAAEDRAERREVARAQRRAVTLQDVAEMTASGLSDQVIIAQVRNSGCAYSLSAKEVIWLQNQGVREPVIRELQATAYRPVRHVYTAVPVAPAGPVYVVQPVPPPPPVGVGVGISIGGRR